MECPNTASDFRPIACCTTLYKIISKVLTARLSAVLDSIVSVNQSAFIKGRSIMENVLICQDLVRNYHRNIGTPRCIMKLDLKKAYDSLEWVFLADVMKYLQFPDRFIKWVLACISSTSFSFMINGKSYGLIRGKRGLRQGDPISPLLFVLGMEYFSRLMKGVADNPNFSYHPKCKRMKINHLSFADDLTIFCKADLDSTILVRQAIEEFGNTSGLRTNPSKCQLFMAGVQPNLQQEVVKQLKFMVGELPVRYLGMPLISTRLSDTDCKPIIDRIKKKIQSWSSRTLSYAGRLQLVNAVIFPIQVYWSSILVLPVSILKKIDSLCLNFLWQSQEGKKPMALVSWQQVCLPRNEGGLGVKQLKVWNKAALGKHIWNLNCKANSLWSSWLQANYLKGESFWKIKIPQDCFWGLRKLLQLRDMYKSSFKVQLGDGRETSLFYDWWTGTVRLSDREGLRDEVANWDSHARVNQWRQNGQWTIPMSFCRKWPDIAAEIQQIQVLNDTDFVTWIHTGSGVFSISSAYEVFRRRGNRRQWAKVVWGGGIMPRHSFTTWLLYRNCLKTRSLLVSRGMQIDNICLLCNRQPETCEHIFFQCQYSKLVWQEVLRWLGYLHIPDRWNVERRWIVRKASGRSRKARKLRIAVSCTIYSLWQERNSILFNSVQKSPSVVVKNIKEIVQLRK